MYVLAGSICITGEISVFLNIQSYTSPCLGVDVLRGTLTGVCQVKLLTTGSILLLLDGHWSLFCNVQGEVYSISANIATVSATFESYHSKELRMIQRKPFVCSNCSPKFFGHFSRALFIGGIPTNMLLVCGLLHQIL